MKWDSTRYFVAAARYKSFSKAAGALGITQSALSKQIAALEEESGFRLLERNSRGVQLTPAGRYLYREGMEINYQIQSLFNQLRYIQGFGQQSLDIECNWDCMPELSRIINAFLQVQPGIRFNLTNPLYRYPAEGEAYSSAPDLTLRCYDMEEPGAGLVLYGGRERLIINSCNPMSQSGALCLNDLSGMQLSMLRSYPPHARWIAFLRENRPDIGIIEVSSSNELFTDIMANPLKTAMIWGPSTAYEGYARPVPFKEGRMQQVRLVPGPQDSNLVRAFMDTAREVFGL